MFQDNNVIFRFVGPLGVEVHIGSSLAILGFLFVGLSFSGMGDLIWSLSMFAMLVGSIYLHELGHAFGCRIQGVPVTRIMLYGGGGFCQQSRSANAHQQELIVAMGPIVNLVLWALSSLIVWNMINTFDYTNEAARLPAIFPYLSVFAQLNLALALFNLLPVQPLDGGKLFHLILLRVLPPALAQRIVGGFGLVVALLWWPALLLFYLSTGWLLLFAPSIRLHWAYANGRAAV